MIHCDNEMMMMSSSSLLLGRIAALVRCGLLLQTSGMSVCLRVYLVTRSLQKTAQPIEMSIVCRLGWAVRTTCMY